MKYTYDELLVTIADYVCSPPDFNVAAVDGAFIALKDALACMWMGQEVQECRRILGPIVPDTLVPCGSRVIGTSLVLDPVKAAFDMTACIRWLDYNDTWLASEWGHPSDNLGALLAVMDYGAQRARVPGQAVWTVRDLLHMMIKAYEIQGVLALNHAFNAQGLDHVILLKVAATAMSSYIIQPNKDKVLAALSHAFVDGHPLRTYRHSPNTTRRKSWAAADAVGRAVLLAWLVQQGDPGIPTVLTAPRWGLEQVLFKGQKMQLAQPLGSYVMENILFKISYPAEFHGQTAVEAALALHQQLKGDCSSIERIEIATQKAGCQIIHKTGPLNNYADRDHCIEYMVAVALLHGEITAHSYTDEFASDPKIDALRAKMTVVEDPIFTKHYFDPQKRYIPNRVTVQCKDGRSLSKTVEAPLGHPTRRGEGLPLLEQKFQNACQDHYPKSQAEKISALMADPTGCMDLSIDQFIGQLLTTRTQVGHSAKGKSSTL